MICCRCNKPIDTSYDKWVVIQDWDRGEKTAEKEMHLDCWKKMYQEKVKEQINRVTEKLKSVMPNITGLLPNMKNNGK